jgi:hypothetical protein
MLLPDNIHPEQTIYYTGSIVLSSLYPIKKAGILDLYILSKKIKDISFPVFILSLDWLFLIGVIKFNSQKEIELCS